MESHLSCAFRIVFLFSGCNLGFSRPSLASQSCTHITPRRSPTFLPPVALESLAVPYCVQLSAEMAPAPQGQHLALWWVQSSALRQSCCLNLRRLSPLTSLSLLRDVWQLTWDSSFFVTCSSWPGSSLLTLQIFNFIVRKMCPFYQHLVMMRGPSFFTQILFFSPCIVNGCALGSYLDVLRLVLVAVFHSGFYTCCSLILPFGFMEKQKGQIFS